MTTANRLNQLKALLEDDPSDSFLLFAVAKEYETLNDLDLSLEYFLKLLDTDPDYVGLYYHLGKLYETLDDESKALKTYNDGINVCKKQSDWHALGELNNAKTNLELNL